MFQPRWSRFDAAATRVVHSRNGERQDEPPDIDDADLHGILEQLRGLEQLCALELALVSVHPGRPRCRGRPALVRSG
jgi:hypothetical protein